MIPGLNYGFKGSTNVQSDTLLFVTTVTELEEKCQNPAIRSFLHGILVLFVQLSSLHVNKIYIL